MKRRDFLRASAALAAGAAAPMLATPLARAQQAKMHRVAWLSVVSEKGSALFLETFMQGMAAHGYVPGRNLVIDARYGNDSREALDKLATEAAALKPAVFVTQGPALHTARKVHGNIPVVFAFSGDPVELGIVQSLGRPGGRFTGVTFLAYDLAAKRVELLREVLPAMKRIGVISNPDHAGDHKEFEVTRQAAAKLGVQVSHHPAGNAAEVERALKGIAATGADAMVVHPDALMVQQRDAIARFSIQNRIPAVSGWASIAEGGTLMTYGPIPHEAFRRVASHVDRILRGASPAELPVELPTKFEMVVNLRTAKALGVTLPQSILLRADRVIE